MTFTSSGSRQLRGSRTAAAAAARAKAGLDLQIVDLKALNVLLNPHFSQSIPHLARRSMKAPAYVLALSR
jgi:hypothetical protein